MEQERKAKKSKGDLWAPALKPSRIEALTDGVLAIAMTILVLELSRNARRVGRSQEEFRGNNTRALRLCIGIRGTGDLLDTAPLYVPFY
jgi:hypothetical protein